jgi:restriction system protein
MDQERIIDTKDMDWEEWLNLTITDQVHFLYPIFCCFPTDKIKAQYLKIVHERPELEIRHLLRAFVISTGNFGQDENALEIVKSWNKEKLTSAIDNCEQLRRFFSPNSPNWEGLTWILDLLPHSPNLAIEVIKAYLIHDLPDFRYQGLVDTISIITTRYLEKKHPRELFLQLQPHEFEWLVEAVFKKKGYDTVLTQQTHDGGIDIIAKKNDIGGKELALIQCKRYRHKITINEVRNLYGVVCSEKATKGFLVSSSEFTPPAKKFVLQNPSIELIDWKDLVKLLNQNLGANWNSRIHIIFSEKMKAKVLRLP